MDIMTLIKFKPIKKKDSNKLTASIYLKRGKGADISKEEANQLVDWANEAAGQAALLDAVLTGKLLIDIVDGEITFSEPDDLDHCKNAMNVIENGLEFN